MEARIQTGALPAVGCAGLFSGLFRECDSGNRELIDQAPPYVLLGGIEPVASCANPFVSVFVKRNWKCGARFVVITELKAAARTNFIRCSAIFATVWRRTVVFFIPWR